jgi:DNA primase
LLPEFAQTIGLATDELADLWQLETHGSVHRAASNHSTPPNTIKRERHFFSEISGDHAFDADAPWPEPEPDWQRDEGPTRSGSAPWAPGSRGGRYAKYNRTAKPSARPRGPAPPLATRADRVARTLLSQPSAWNCLTPEDHHLLAKQPDPLGALFRWLESQWHEHGAQPWAALQQAIAQEDFAQVANQLISQGLHLQPIQSPDDPSPPPPDSHAELREVLSRMHIDDLMGRETLALAEAGSHPESLQTYREIHDRRLALQRQLTPSANGD